MSMPGFVFHFRCPCGANSDAFSVFPFSSTFEPILTLPTWSTRYKFWGSFNSTLTDDDRHELERDSQRLQEFAASISSKNLTVAVPRLVSGRVEVIPAPCCPKCGNPCESIFGYPPSSGKPSLGPEMLENFDSIPITLADLSVRARMICREIGIVTLGDLVEFNSEIVSHPRITQHVVQEIDHVLALKSASGT